MNNVSTISIKIPNWMNELLEKVAKDEDRSKSSLIRLALQEYLDDMEDIKSGMEALAEIERGEATTTPWEDVKKELGL